MDSPTSPLFKESREITANKAEKNTTRFPRDSNRMANHLKSNKQHYEANTDLSLDKKLDI